MSDLLVVDDERSMREFLEILLTKEGWRVRTAAGVDEALALFADKEPDVIITDLKMPSGSGLDLLRQVKTRSSQVEVIVVTAFATDKTAIEALKMGAFDYVNKPFQVDEIRVLVSRALERQRLLRENTRMRAELTGRYDFGQIVGKSTRMQEVYRLIERAAPTRSNVLITGESGTGKELVARAVHLRSDRSRAPFVPIDCASIPDKLLESELFGVAKGAFTGAQTDRQGLFELAHSGTVFLDEIGELPVALQVKLLRVLQERSLKRLGDNRDRPFDVRLLAATNRDIDAEVQRGDFREDLFFRLNVIRIHVPPLRERREDIPLLVKHFLQSLARDEGRPMAVALPEAMEALQQYDYPGNVRELMNLVEQAAALCQDRPIGADVLVDRMRASTPAGALPAQVDLGEGFDLDQVLAGVERRILEQALRAADGVKTDAARLLGISFRSLRYRLSKLEME